MRNLSNEKPSNEKLDKMFKLMGQMEDVLYEIKKPTVGELRSTNKRMIERLRTEAELKRKENTASIQ